MLCVNTYKKAYIDECRASMEAQLAAYRALLAAAKGNAGTGKPTFSSPVDRFERLFFNNLVVVLDSFFVHCSRTLEKMDGNPLNEVRIICNSIMQNHGVLAADNTIKWNPAKSVLKLQIGDEIKLSESDFVLLFNAFFAEIEAKFV